MALMIVLALLVLLTILAVGFLSWTMIERRASSAYYEGTQCQLLADTAVNLVQGQIDHASSQKALNRPLAWASQPGMIRTFKADGALMNAYKLYSDDEMVASDVNAGTALKKLRDWDKSPAFYVDLNEPVLSEGTQSVKWTYPIISASVAPKADGTSEVGGFSVTAAPSATAKQPIPMPVKWLYILEDGQLIAPAGSGSIAAIPEGSKTNPVIGRIAFWTDDETCKLNINTASHGSFWDIPRAFTLEERDRMARFQPALREFQRYPGHPATTSLWPVFRSKFPDEAAFENFVYGLENNNDEPGISPRVQQGGSLDGTRVAPDTEPPGVKLDNARLYSSVDELLFKPSRDVLNQLSPEDLEKARFFLTARSNAPEINLFNLPRMSIWPINTGSKSLGILDKLIAFCSTINAKPYYLTRENSGSSTEDVNARNAELLNYINILLELPVPGFGNSTFVGKYTQPECEQISTEIFDYIRSSNLYATVRGSDPYTPGDLTTAGSGVGQVVPLQTNGTKGIGRIPVLSRAVLQFFVSGATNDDGTIRFEPPSEKTPKYSDPVETDALYSSFKNFLTEIGVGKPVKLLTSGIIYFDTFDPMYGYVAPRYDYSVEVEFRDPWTVNGVPLNIPDATLNISKDHASVFDATTNTDRALWYGRNLGGTLGPVWMMQNYGSLRGNPPNGSFAAYPLVSDRVAIHTPVNLVADSNGDPSLPPNSVIKDQIVFSGGTVEAKLKVGAEVIQTYVFDFPPTTKPTPVYADGTIRARYNPSNPVIDPLRQFAVSSDFRHRWTRTMRNHRFYSPNSTPGGEADYVDLRLIQDGDVTLSLEPAYGDKRLLAGRARLETGSFPPSASTSFVPHEDYFNTERTAVDLRTDSFGWDQSLTIPGSRRLKAGRILDLSYGPNAMPDIPSRYRNGVVTLNPNRSQASFPPDFDNGTLHMPDDAYVSRADEGSSYDNTANVTRSYAWFNLDTAPGLSITEPTFYSPNKQLPSAVKFGSLPTGVVRNLPWQTLLFRPDPGGHPGAQNPPDYLMLDLFWMPVVEPYAISEPLSTNGKVNLNFQIMPFSYIERATALYGVLQSQEILAIPDIDAGSGTSSSGGYASADEYKKAATDASDASYSSHKYRKKLNIDGEGGGTLQGFRDVFNKNKIFISETQICSLPLIPAGEPYSDTFESTYWNSRRLTGDNSREMPYSHLLPRLTTRSNTYTIHYVVQSLKQSPASRQQKVWDESKDTVSAELRGSRMIERYIDPDDSRIPNYAAASPAELATLPTLDAFYQWRVIHNREFGR